MTQTADLEVEWIAATDGNIASNNLESARQRSWSRFWRAPEQPRVAELIVEQEQLTAQFTGDLAALDRLEMLASEVTRAQPDASRAALIAGQVACTTHRFAEARIEVARARDAGAATLDTERLSLCIDQATGTDLQAVLAARRVRAAQPASWDEGIPLASLLAELGEYDEAESTYMQALREYPDVSPFALAWICFQLGALWGEVVPVPEPARAARWYRKAVDYLPCYVKARVHLSEILLAAGDHHGARTLLSPVLESGDPEVAWRMADVAKAAGDDADANAYLDAARTGFEDLLARHMLAFADHAAEFYMGSGSDARRALELARLNLANRPTPRAFELYADASERSGVSPCPTAEHS